MASFQKRGKTWQYTISHKPKPIRKGGFKTKKEAQVAASIIEEELRKGIVPHLREIPFDEYFLQWLHDYKTDIVDITFERYENTHQAIVDRFKGKTIQSISKRDYQRFLNEYALTHAKETTRKLNIHIRACVREAIDEGIIRVDFTRDAIVTGNVAAKKPEEKHLGYEETETLLNELHNRLHRSLGYYLLLLGLTTGMRFGELVGLTRSDFDFTNNEITINKTWDYKKGEGFQPTKDNSDRVIEVDKETLGVFEELFDAPSTALHDLVFFSEQSKYRVLSNEAMNKLLRNTLKYLGFDKINENGEKQTITVHGLRHTHASILLYKKVSIYYVSERLGHATVDTTMRHYAHVIKELREQDTKISVDTFKNMRTKVKEGIDV
ncbi:tyrosine-type recombinase/integrase [Sporosarcina soli]|uniref:Tyrosine-type recombinase/integrase n=1 Tax=Sporosarcina soli TaxID=334736 RepID=A0ABW0TQE7_9BACL